jgi:hypothetical protein
LVLEINTSDEIVLPKQANGECQMAETKTQSRAGARSAATGASQTASTGRTMPKPATDGGTDAAQETAQVEPTAIVVIAPNPKRPGSQSYGFYEKYGPTCVMTNADECKARGVRGKDLTWDADRRHILVDEEAKNFPIDGSKEEQAKYLLGLKNPPSEASLIKWGYLPEPVKTETTEKTNA